jgi:hypothetical protein
MPGQVVPPATAVASRAAQGQVSMPHPAGFTDAHLMVLAAGLAAELDGCEQSIFLAGRTLGRIPSLGWANRHSAPPDELHQCCYCMLQHSRGHTTQEA